MSDAIREQFEAKFPRPANAFVDADGLYSGGEWVSFYNARWEAWLAAMAQAAQEPVAAQKILDLILDECRYWHGRDEARRGGFAILYASAKEVVDQLEQNQAAAEQPECSDCRGLEAEIVALRSGKAFCGACGDGCEACEVEPIQAPEQQTVQACGHPACEALGEPHPFCEFVQQIDASHGEPSPAQAEQQPVAWMRRDEDGYTSITTIAAVLEDWQRQGVKVQPLYAAPPAAQAAENERLRDTIEDLEFALQDAEGRADNAGRNASAFEDMMGNLQVANGKLADIAELVEPLSDAAGDALKFLMATSEHDQLCGVFDLDDDGRHKDCTCGLKLVMGKLRTALAAQGGSHD